MNRRHFIKSLLLVTPSLVTLPKLIQQSGASDSPATKTESLTEAQLAGTRYDLRIGPEGNLYIGGDFVYGIKESRYNFETQAWEYAH